MPTIRQFCVATVLFLGCSGGGNLCKNVQCVMGQTCDPTTGDCVNNNTGMGGGSGGGDGGHAGGSADGGKTLTPLPLTGSCAAVTTARCGTLERCQLINTTDDAECQALIGAGCTWEKDVTAGVSLYDGEAAAHCVADWVAQDCENRGVQPASCAGVETTGQGMAMAGCDPNSALPNCNVDAGVYCPATGATCSACTAYVQAGATCSIDDGLDIQCGPGLACDGVGDALTGICNPVGGPNQECGFDEVTEDSVCNPGLYCNLAPADGGQSGACEPALPAADPCTDDTDCQTTLYCPFSTQTCTALIADGMPCNDDDAMTSSCLNGHCSREPNDDNSDFDAGMPQCGFLMVGDICADDDDCGPSGFCSGYVPAQPDAGTMGGTCAATSASGAPCTNTYQPSAGSFVFSTTRPSDSCTDVTQTCLDGTCVSTAPFSRKLGDSCDRPGQCGSSSRCDLADPLTADGHCVALAMIGDVCATDTDCVLGSYCLPPDFDSSIGTCTAFAANGTPCDPATPYEGDGITGEFANGCNFAAECMNDPDGGTGLCQPLVPAGTPCDTTNGPLCYASFCGDAGTCMAGQPVGTACDAAAECAAGSCSNPDGGFDDETCQMACF